jgi:hypothetical protein
MLNFMALYLAPRLKRDTNEFGKLICNPWGEDVNRPKKLNAVSTKSTAPIFSPSLPFAPFGFTKDT